MEIKRAQLLFENTYGVSVIEDIYPEGIRYEIGVLRHNFTDGSVSLTTEFKGNALISRLTQDTLLRTINKIKELPNGTNRQKQNGSERQNKQSSNETTTYSI